MYNGIGLATPRGSGTNGHVQRNWALVKPRIKEKTYKSEQELEALDTVSNKQPNKEILDHERKRKIELKCAEFADILEEQGFTEEAINNKINNYRNMLLGQAGKLDKPVDQWGRLCVTGTHQVAEAQQEKNARLREAFGISEYFVDGSSFDPDRQAKEKLAKSVALFEKEKQEVEREKQREQEKSQAAQYHLIHTPSPEPPPLTANEIVTKKKKRKHRNSTSSEEPKKKKKKKNRKKDRSGKVREKRKKKKYKKEFLEKSSTSENDSANEDERKKSKKKEKRIIGRKRKHPSSESSRESSPEPSNKPKLDNTFENGQRNKYRKHKNLKTSDSNCNPYVLKSKTSSTTEKKNSKCNRSRSPYSKRNCSWRSRSPYNDSKERSYDDSPKSRKFAVKRRSRSGEKRKIFKSSSLERTLSPDITKKTKKSDGNVKKKNKIDLSNSKLSVPEKFRKSRSRSLDGNGKHKNNKSLSQDRPRSQLVNKELNSEKYSDKKEQLEQSKNKRTKSIALSHERRHRKSLTPNRDNPGYSSYFPRKHERHASPNQSDKKRLKSPKTNVNRNNGVKNDENNSNCETSSYEEPKSHKYYCNKLSSRESSTEIGITYKSREHNTYIMSCMVKEDKNTETSLIDNSGKQEDCMSLTPDRKSSSVNNVNNKYKLKSNTPDIKRNIRQKDTSEKHSKSVKPLPVVRLRASSNEADLSDTELEKEEEEDDKEVKILKLLKTDLAAKAKESLERKKEKPPNPQHVMRRRIEPDFFDIKVLPLKIGKEKSNVINKDEFDIERNGNADNSKPKAKNASSDIGLKSRSRSSSHSSASSKESQRSKSSCSTQSPSRSRTISRSRSRSSSMSNSSESSSTTRSRSPSIPRRHGSPSFLDRRRITRHK